MVKIYKDFFDTDCLEYIEETIEKGRNSASLRSSFFYWSGNIIHESTPVMIYDMYDTDILSQRLKENIDIKNDLHFMIYYWPVGSYIPWHNDGHVNFTATMYCNRFWDRDWGGLFLYEKKDKILAEVPEWNKLIIQTDKDFHSTTSVTKPYYRPVADANGYTMIPDIRTTLQIFEDNV